MFVVIPFCHKDEWLALKNLEWAKKLDGRTSHTAMVVHDDTISGDQVRHAAEQFFEKVIMFRYPKWPGRDLSWPIVQNHQFQETATFISYNGPREPWLWWEPDAVPLKPSWITAIEEAHKEGGKPYAGHMVTGDPFQNGQTISWMTGVGVYPFNVPSHSGAAMSCMRHPWDVASHREVGKKCTPINHLIQHIWEIDGAPVSFRDDAAVRDVVSDGAVLFHRTKDGSLIDILNGEPLHKAIVAAATNAIRRISAAASKLLNSKDATAIVQLGRYGDIVNALPAIRNIAVQQDTKPVVVVGKDFCKVLDGVSYATVDVFQGTHGQLQAAIDYAKLKYHNVIVGQVWGENFKVEQKCTAYNVDSWERLGMLSRWGERQPPVFDSRDYTRERELLKIHTKRNPLPTILVSLTGGVTSKTAKGAAIKRSIMDEFSGQANIVDLDSIRAERVYDVLGLMETADGIVTSDTVWLHLAADTLTPVAAFLSNKGRWMRSETRCNCTLKLYGETDDDVGKLRAWIKDRISKCTNRKYVHCCESHRPLPKRVKRAQSSWTTLQQGGRWKMAFMEEYPRDTRMLGEPRAIPFLKDVLEYGLAKADNDSYLIMTNDDTILVPDVVRELDLVMSQCVAASSGRVDVEHWTGTVPAHGPETHKGRDMLCFRVPWLRMNLDTIPDYALGFCDWDTGMSPFVRRLAGEPWSYAITWNPCGACELPAGGVLHETHAATWADNAGKPSPGLLHNRKLMKSWNAMVGGNYGDGISWWDEVGK